jgi:hypothetical protein
MLGYWDENDGYQCLSWALGFMRGHRGSGFAKAFYRSSSKGRASCGEGICVETGIRTHWIEFALLCLWPVRRRGGPGVANAF